PHQASANEIQEGDVTSRNNWKMQIGRLRGRCATWVDDYKHRRIGSGALSLANTVKRDGVSFGHVRANHQNQVRLVDVVVAAWRSVRTQARAVARDGGRHAQPAIRVYVVCAEMPLEQLADEVGSLTVELPAPVKRHRIRTMLG